MNRALRATVVLLFVAAIGWALSAQKPEGPDRPRGYWPQWRGPERNSVSKETGLLKTWPEAGPPLYWSAKGLGAGVASVAVAGGRVFTLGKLGDDEHLTALDEGTGKKLWAVPLGPAMKGESPLMRYLSQRTPTIDGERIYAFTARGDLVCCGTADGKELWRKSYPTDFQGRTGVWGWCDRPLVDGDRLICTPGGKDSTVVALDKKSGDVVWRCAVPGAPSAAYCATTIAEVGGIRQYVAFLGRGPVGVAAKDGRFLWHYDKVSNATGNNYTPLVRGDLVFCASGYGKGMALLKLTADKEEVRADEVWFRSAPLQPWYDGTILVGDHVYAGGGRDVLCAELATGKTVWQDRGAIGGAVSMASAEGNLYLLSQEGKVALIEASPKGYTLKGKFQIPDAVARPGATAPVIAGGRLYLRDDDRLFCYDIREGGTGKPDKEPEPPAPPEPRKPVTAPRSSTPGEPDAVFVPTPQDVVDRMTELARIQPTDRVYDLGCGDGRIAVTAAARYGCRAVGIDIDPECVRLSRENVDRHRLGARVTIEQRDLFTVDLSDADVVFLYLSPELNERLLPQLAKLKPGARIVSHAFTIPGVPADKVVTQPSTEDYLDHALHVWTAPLRKR
jgi:outer membrane protein assembly factor BamB